MKNPTMIAGLFLSLLSPNIKDMAKITPIVGIYKITSPSGKVYIGQSVDIKKRWYNYRSAVQKEQTLLYRSFKKYGHKAHSFEIIHTLPSDVSRSILDAYEIFYIKQYKECGVKLMNLSYGGDGGKHSKETRDKISATLKQKNIIPPSRKGTVLSESHRLVLLNSRKGKKNSAEHNEILRENGNKVSKEHLTKMIAIRKQKRNSRT